MTPDAYRTHQANLLADRAISTAMAYGHAERNHGAGQGGYGAILQDRLDKLTAIINELRDLALGTTDAVQEGQTEQAHAFMDQLRKNDCRSSLQDRNEPIFLYPCRRDAGHGGRHYSRDFLRIWTDAEQYVPEVHADADTQKEG